MQKKTLETVFEAMYHGKYDFADFVSGDVPANYDHFKIREKKIYRPNKKLKAYHSFLNLFMFQNLRTNQEVVFSYRKGTNVYGAVSRHSKNRYFFQTDFSNFFYSLTSEIVRKTIAESLDHFAVVDAGNYLDRIVELVTVEGRMPVGFSTSPLISNGCLFEFDNILNEHCQKNDLIYTRYSDDLIISTSSNEAIDNIEKHIDEALKMIFGEGLVVNQRKSRFSSRGGKIKLLGVVILPNGVVTVDTKLKTTVEVLLHFYIKDRQSFLELSDGNEKNGLEKLSGYLNYINTVDAAYLNKLRKKYGLTVVDMFLHKSAK